MSDDADKADITQGKILSSNIENIRKAANVKIEGAGLCLSCGNEVEPVKLSSGKMITGRWCDALCRDRNGSTI